MSEARKADDARNADAQAIDAYLDRACGHLGLGSILREHIRDELRGHILDAVEGHVERGLPRQEAVARALGDLGDPGDVAAGLKGVYGRHVVRLLVERAMEWRERTMKSGWKWTFVAHATVAILLVAEVLFILGAATYIFPVVEAEYQGLGLRAPSYWQSTLAIVRLLFEWGPLLLGLAVGALAVFEWRYRGENKPVVRLAVGGTVGVTLMALVWATAFAMCVPLVQLHFQANDETAAAVVRRRALDAEVAYRDLEGALAGAEADKVRQAAHGLGRAMSDIDRARAGVLALAALDQGGEELSVLRERVREVERCARVLAHPDSQAGDPVETWRGRLEAAYARLTGAVRGWPKAPGAPEDRKKPFPATPPAK